MQASCKSGMPGAQPSALHRSLEIKALCKLLCLQDKTCHSPFPALSNPSSPACGMISHLKMSHLPNLPVPSQAGKARVHPPLDMIHLATASLTAFQTCPLETFHTPPFS